MKQPSRVHPKDKMDHLTRHHCYPKGRMKKEKIKSVHINLTLRIWRKKHNYWHSVFRFKTIDEVIYELQFKPQIQHHEDYNKVFKCKPHQASQILQRFKRIKTRNEMTHNDAMAVAREVSEALKGHPHLYVVITIRENGDRDVKVRRKEGNYVN